MLLDPVGLTEMAERAGVKPDTAKKWRDRYPETFPKPRAKVGKSEVWEWALVLRWLQDSGRAPRTLRYRERGGGSVLAVETLVDGDRWQPIALFIDAGVGDWRARPTRYAIDSLIEPPPISDASDTNEADEADADEAADDWAARRQAAKHEAQLWANRLLEGWDKARADWVREHPDEPMPAHLVGTRRAVYTDEG